MNTSNALTTNAGLLAQLLERMERNGCPDAGQYRLVALRLADELAGVADANSLELLLQSSGVASDLYENLNYQHAGLCRSLLDDSLSSEQRAREAIQRARRPLPEDSAR